MTSLTAGLALASQIDLDAHEDQAYYPESTWGKQPEPVTKALVYSQHPEIKAFDDAAKEAQDAKNSEDHDESIDGEGTIRVRH